jgi:hypothetical protein
LVSEPVAQVVLPKSERDLVNNQLWLVREQLLVVARNETDSISAPQRLAQFREEGVRLPGIFLLGYHQKTGDPVGFSEAALESAKSELKRFSRELEGIAALSSEFDGQSEAFLLRLIEIDWKIRRVLVASLKGDFEMYLQEQVRPENINRLLAETNGTDVFPFDLREHRRPSLFSSGLEKDTIRVLGKVAGVLAGLSGDMLLRNWIKATEHRAVDSQNDAIANRNTELTRRAELDWFEQQAFLPGNTIAEKLKADLVALGRNQSISDAGYYLSIRGDVVRVDAVIRINNSRPRAYFVVRPRIFLSNE